MWCSDNVINACQFLLSQQFPNCRGLFETQTLHCGNNRATSDLPVVQIVYDALRQHWITASTLGCAGDNVNVYCSLGYTPNQLVVKFISACIKFPGSYFSISLKNTMRQREGYDCGFFAIAYATSLLHGVLPENVIFDQKKMRKHTVQCLQSGRMELYPVLNLRAVRFSVNSVAHYDLYCSCKVSFCAQDKMIQCNTCLIWYHFECLNMSLAMFRTYADDKGKEFFCNNCKTV